LKIPTRRRLTQAYPRTIAAREFFPASTEDLLHFFLSDAVIENMRQRRFRIDPKAKVHAAIPSINTDVILLEVEAR
jgi:hypothetical protein